MNDLTAAGIAFLEAIAEESTSERTVNAAHAYADELRKFAATRTATPAPRPAPTGAVFPSYGRAKGLPVAGATRQDLEYYAAGARRTLADESKSRFHDKERALLAAIEAEIVAQDAKVSF